jgi:hypothetical protein
MLATSHPISLMSVDVASLSDGSLSLSIYLSLYLHLPVRHLYLRNHGHIRARRVQRPHARLLRHQPGDGAIDLGRQKALGADREEAEHAVQCGGDGEVCWGNENVQMQSKVCGRQ